MTKRKMRSYLQVCTVAIALGVPILAEPAGTTPGAANQLSNEFVQARKKWRRGSFYCGKCDGGEIQASVTVFEHPNGLGKMQGFLPEMELGDIDVSGKYRADKGDLGEVGDDTISSLRVEKGYMAELCANDGGDGDCWDFEAGEHNVPAEFDNQTSFIWVQRR